MKRIHTIAACFLAACTFVKADEPASKPSVTISPAAQALIGEIAAAYGKLPAAEFSGTITGRFDVDGDKKVFDEKFTSSFERGTGFRHEMTDDVLAVGNNQKVYLYHPRSRVFSQADVAPAAPAIPDDVDEALRQQNDSLALALSSDVRTELSKDASAIDRAADSTIDGVKCVTLKLDGDVPETLAFDADTHLLRQMSFDLRKDLTKRGAANVTQAEVVMDYTAVKPDAKVDASAFAWTPPEGSRDSASAGALDQGGEASELAGKPAPDLSLTGLDGQPFKLSAHKGSVVVLDFWATWCGPCRAALPHLDEIYQQKREAGLQVFAVDQGETEAAVKAFVTDSKLGVPVVLDPDGAAGAKYKVEGIPQTVVIGKDGSVKKVFVGFDEDGVKSAIEQALAEK